MIDLFNPLGSVLPVVSGIDLLVPTDSFRGIESHVTPSSSCQREQGLPAVSVPLLRYIGKPRGVGHQRTERHKQDIQETVLVQVTPVSQAESRRHFTTLYFVRCALLDLQYAAAL